MKNPMQWVRCDSGELPSLGEDVLIWLDGHYLDACRELKFVEVEEGGAWNWHAGYKIYHEPGEVTHWLRVEPPGKEAPAGPILSCVRAIMVWAKETEHGFAASEVQNIIDMHLNPNCVEPPEEEKV